MFQDSVSVSITMVKKRENIALLKLTDTIFFSGTFSSSDFFHVEAKKHLAWHNLRLSYSQSIHAIETVTF
jgi:hypothetical protein